MKIKFISLVLCFMMVLVVLAGCGASNEGNTSPDEQATTSETTNQSTDSTASTSQTGTTENIGNKKIVIVQESKDQIRDDTEKKILEALEKGGFTKTNSQITEIQMMGDIKKSEDFVKQIKDMKPDVVVINSSSNSYETVGKALGGTGIPVVLCVGADTIGAVDENGKPKDNITGLYTMPKDLQKSAFNLLQKISPLSGGKKAVFVTTDGFFKKEDVEKNLKEIGVELKDYCESKYMEDFQAAVTKYNADDEVGWILVGVWPGIKKDGTTGIQVDTAKWDIANRKKPAVTYWSVAVEMGINCGLGVDLVEVGAQAGEMAAQILKGTKVSDVTAQNPRKVNIEINKKACDNLKMQIPGDILGSAKVYDKTINDK